MRIGRPRNISAIKPYLTFHTHTWVVTSALHSREAQRLHKFLGGKFEFKGRVGTWELICTVNFNFPPKHVWALCLATPNIAFQSATLMRKSPNLIGL